jgi:protein-S-isoprenylcysteine O-methyltransferase Ste14
MVWIPALVESALVLAQEGYLPAHWSSMIMDTCAGPITRGQLLSPLVVAGAALALAGTAFRLSAYRTLGRHFTFELAVQKDHALVTAYPYNIVRHPSYTGYLATMAGAGLALGTRDGWVRAALVPWLARAPATPAKVSAAAYGGLGLGLYAFMAGMFLWRVGAEDAMMRKQFGPQWDAWARRVPYEIVPFVF